MRWQPYALNPELIQLVDDSGKELATVGPSVVLGEWYIEDGPATWDGYETKEAAMADAERINTY